MSASSKIIKTSRSGIEGRNKVVSCGAPNSILKKELETQVNIVSQVWQCMERILIVNNAELIQDAVEVKINGRLQNLLIRNIQRQLTFTCSMPAIETLQKGVKYVQI